MKTLVKYIFSFSMILVLLVSTMQISLYKMECLMSGDIQISLSKFDDCEKIVKNNTAAIKKCCDADKTCCDLNKKCCDSNNIILDFDYESSNINEFKTLLPLLFALNLNSSISNKLAKVTDYHFYTNLPPPGGYELLKLVQIFRI